MNPWPVLQALSPAGRRAFRAAAAGYGLAGFDLLSFTFVLVAVQAAFGLSGGQAGWLATASLLASAVGGVLGGALADGIGRTRTMLLAITVYAVATAASGFAQSFEQLLFCRVLLGLGFGAEWTASSLLVAEYAAPASRGRLLGLLASAFSLGDALAAVAGAVVLALLPATEAWRALFWLGFAPALLVLWARTRLVDAPVYTEARAARPRQAPHLAARWRDVREAFGTIFGAGLGRTTVAATALASGALSGRYVVTVWLPSYLLIEIGLDTTNTTLLMLPVLAGSFLGYLVGGSCQDRFGRRPTFAAAAGLSLLVIVLYTRVGPDDAALLAVCGALVGGCTSAVLAGLGAYLAELYPTAVRGLGQGFSYSTGRAVAAIPVAGVGSAAATIGLGPAIAISGAMYLLCLLALASLPETKGRRLDEPEPNATARVAVPTHGA